MLSIIYASTAVNLFTSEELIELLDKSRKHNTQNGITGMLLYRGGNFIQVIEGETEDVMELYQKIENDPRHKDVTLLSKDPIKARQFSDWSMGFGNIDEMTVAQLEGYTEFLNEDFTPQYFRDHPTRAYILLLSFKDMMR